MDSISTTSLVLLVFFVASAQQAQAEFDAVAAHEKARQTHYFTSWAVEVGGANGAADQLARKHGLINRGQIGNLKNYYLFTHGNGMSKATTKELSKLMEYKTAALQEEEMVGFIEQQQVLHREKRSYVPPADQGWTKQWSLLNTGQTKGPKGLDLNVEPVWMQNITGFGVVVAFVDDGLDWKNKDLIDNYDKEASYDFIHFDKDPTPDKNSDEPNRHGTSCAGEVGMGKNCRCGVGVAYECNIGALKFDVADSSDAIEASALGNKDQYISIYSNSWGPSDFGFVVDGPGRLTKEALATGVREGRGGKGNIYVWATGNGGWYYDSCAADGFSSSIYTIAIGSADQHGRQASYDEDCAAKMAVTFSFNSDTFNDSSNPYDQIYTTTLNGKCTDDFTGTSASAPLVSGVIALTLQANPNLTWRDVQYLIAYTSNTDVLIGDDWVTNGAGLKVSHHFGFGAIDAEAMVTRAKRWISVPEQYTLSLDPFTYAREVYHQQQTIPIIMRSNSLRFVEHVVVTLTLNVSHSDVDDYGYDDFFDEVYTDYDNIDALYDWLENEHPRRGDIKVELTSPHGTKSVLLPYRNYDFVNEEGYGSWPFMSVHFWGENPVGTWNVTITYKSHLGHVHIGDIGMDLYGTKTIPESVQSIPSHCDPACARNCSGEGSANCDVCSNFRNVSTLKCVDSCPNGTRVYKKYCLPKVESKDKIDCSSDSGINALRAGLISLGVFIAVVLGLIIIAVIVAVKYMTAKKKKVQFRQLHMTPVET